MAAIRICGYGSILDVQLNIIKPDKHSVIVKTPSWLFISILIDISSKIIRIILNNLFVRMYIQNTGNKMKTNGVGLFKI